MAQGKVWAATSLAVAGAYAAATLAARAAGAGVVSDDDFARVVIAQGFAASPRLDPSGTSWLPAPFWVYGATMAASSASLAAARATATALAALSGALLVAGGAALRLSPLAAALAALLPLSVPLAAVLGAAPVPELPAAACTAFALLALARGPLAPARWWWASSLALLFATLSRYDAWPAALAFSACLAWWSPRRRALLAFAALALAGPALWMLWSLHAHGDPLSFVRRVTSYRRALGPGAAALGAYPLALLREAPVWILGAAWIAWRQREARAPLLSAAAMVLLLSLAEARGGAPTHHPERAVLAVMLVAVAVACRLFSLSSADEAWPPRGSADSEDDEYAGGQGKSAASASPSLRPASASASASALGSASASALVGRGVLLLAVLWGGLRVGATRQGLGPDRSDEVALGEALARALPRGERALWVADSYGFFAAQAALARPGDLVAVVPRSVDPRSSWAGDLLASPRSLAELRAAHPEASWLLLRGAPSWIENQPGERRELPGGARLLRLE